MFATKPLWGLLRPLVGIIAHLIMSNLLIYLFSLREPTHTREILDPTKKGALYISLETKEKKFLHIRGLSLNPKAYLNLKGL